MRKWHRWMSVFFAVVMVWVAITGLFHHLHSGSEGGLWGEIIVMLSGLALVFLTVSGMWVYFQMWKRRRAKRLKKGIFWK